MGRLFIILGVGLVILGLLITYAPRIPWLGKLPGDILIQKEDYTIYLPIATCIVISLLLSGLGYLIQFLLNKFS